MYLHISMLGKLYGQWMFLGSFQRWIWWMMRKNICWNLQNLIHRGMHFLDMYISIISKVWHAPPLFRADIRGSEVTTISNCKIIYIQYNTISKCETMKCILDDVTCNSQYCMWMYLCICTTHIAMSIFLKMKTWWNHLRMRIGCHPVSSVWRMQLQDGECGAQCR